MVALTPEDVAGDDPAAEIVKAMPALWPKTVKLELHAKTVYLRLPDGSLGRGEAPDDLDLVLDDGETICALLSYVNHDIGNSLEQLVEALDLVNISESIEGEMDITFEPPFAIDGQETGLSARYIKGGESELHPIEKIVVTASVKVHVDEIKLTHKKLTDLDVTYALRRGDHRGPAVARRGQRQRARSHDHLPR